MAHKFSTGWAVGVVKTVEKKKSVAGQFAVKYKQKLNREDYGVHKYWGTSCCFKRVNTVRFINNVRSLDQFCRLRFAISRLRLRFLTS
jgi:hypothetical protein